MNGMYAFSIYDKKNNELILARDRVGKKPIYYIIMTKISLFGDLK